MLTHRGTELRTGEEAARMGLSRYKVGAGLAVSDMDRARGFYEGKLGLSVGTGKRLGAVSAGTMVATLIIKGGVCRGGKRAIRARRPGRGADGWRTRLEGDPFSLGS